MKRIVLSLLLLLLPFAARAQFDATRVDGVARAAIDQWKFPAVAIAVVRDDQVVYVKAFGVKQVGGSDAVDIDTLFELGSTSKAFTTTAMAMLVDEKKMSWDDPVRKYVPWFRLADPCADSLLTLRDIVTHRSGLATRDELWDAARYPRDEFLHRLAFVPLSKPIRSSYQYSNMMFALAGESVAAAAKMPWDDFVKTRIFAPLGMSRSRTSSGEWTTATNRATGHWLDRNHAIAVQPFHDYDNIAPAGTVKSTARDMAQWLRFQLADGAIGDKRLLSAQALTETKSPQVALSTSASSPETNVNTYGMGWSVADYRGTLLVSHSGALNGFRTQVALLPKLHAGVVILTNAGRGNGALAARNGVLDALLSIPAASSRDWNAFYRATDDAATAKNEAVIAARAAQRKSGTTPSHPLAAYAGTYDNPGYGPVTISEANGVLTLRWGHASIAMTHWHYDTFNAVSDEDDVDELVRFGLDDAGEVKTLTMFGEEFVRGER